jgi:hypothetical protein
MPCTICFITIAKVSNNVNLYYLFWWPINPLSVWYKFIAFFIIYGWNSVACADSSYSAAIEASKVDFNGINIAFT